jgi:predicted small lipoprotein YifL
MRLGLLLIFGLSVAMCGQKGPLQLPEKSAAVVSQLAEPVLVA